MTGRIVMAVAAALLTGAFVSARQRPASPTTGTAVIAGRVVDGTTGGPVPGVRISLSRDPDIAGLPGATTGADGAPAHPLLRRAPWRFYSTRAEDGRFSLEQIVPGEYLVAAIDEAAMADWPAPVFLDWIASRATRITLSEGERRTLALEARSR